jgi:hypothetical protein
MCFDNLSYKRFRSFLNLLSWKSQLVRMWVSSWTPLSWQQIVDSSGVSGMSVNRRQWCPATATRMSRQTKDLVHKCHSDPGQQASVSGCSAVNKRNLDSSSLAAAVTGARHVTRLPTTRKCVLTLDGYSYVIGESSEAYRFITFSILRKLLFITSKSEQMIIIADLSFQV